MAAAAPPALAPAASSGVAGEPPRWVLSPHAAGPRERKPVSLCGIGTVMLDTPAPPAPGPDAPGALADSAHPSAHAAAAAARAAAAADPAAASDPTAGPLAAAWPALVRHLLAAPEARVRASGWWLAMHPPAADLPGLPAPDAALLGLVQLAHSAGDAWVMQAAVRECQHGAGAPACAGVSARHWLRLDDGNAVAWLTLWGQEPAAADEALHGMARARTADPGWGRLSAQVVQHWPEALPAYLLPAAWMHAMGVESAHSTPGVRAFSQACRSAVARNDTNRRAACDAAAERLMRQGTDLFSRGLGASVGQALGWEPDRRRAHEALRARADAGSLREVQAWADEPYGCAAVDRLRRKIQIIGTRGEAAFWNAQPLLQETNKPK